MLCSMFLLALEESGPCVLACPGGELGGASLACPGGKWSVRPCLPGRRVVRASLLAREENLGPSYLFFPKANRGYTLARKAK